LNLTNAIQLNIVGLEDLSFTFSEAHGKFSLTVCPALQDAELIRKLEKKLSKDYGLYHSLRSPDVRPTIRYDSICLRIIFRELSHKDVRMSLIYRSPTDIPLVPNSKDVDLVKVLKDDLFMNLEGTVVGEPSTFRIFKTWAIQLEEYEAQGEYGYLRFHVYDSAQIK
jgi:hypothetical protein